MVNDSEAEAYASDSKSPSASSDHMVDDSEDDGGGGGGKGSVDSSKQQCLLERRSIKAGDMLLESDGSNDQECHTGRNESDPLLCDVSGPQNSPVNGANVTFFKKREDPVEDDDPCANRKVSAHPTKRCMQNDSAKHNKMEKASGLSQGIMLISQMDAQLQDKASKEHSEPEEDFVDVGINTQIAAEAMSALLFAPCAIEEASESETRNQVSNLSGRNNDTIEGSAPNKKRKFTMKERTGTNASAITCLLNSCEWRHPRAKRSRLIQTHHVPRRKSWGASSSKDRSETNTLSGRLVVSLSGTRQASSCQSGVDLDVLNHASPKKIYGRSHESSRDKDFPRPFLPKEIKRLGGSGKVGDFKWKDLRRRRNLAHVRVLFSHNLDDETIKQQKKV
ncbi:hypothetical protein F2Q70_00000151 [Brassica cretica]|uniref:Uncharacterized protein n=1 Tax=Brassica cretica TaxID=69181 RepID=A0A8S9IX72_BRACR|nr:hypothetical protein F2Q70_00000151 [Brassica cretica]